MATAQDMIARAYRINGDLGAGESLTADQAQIGLDALNAMLGSWDNERISVYRIAQDSYTWPAATTSRTIGPGGDFNQAHRPMKIEAGTYFTDANNVPYFPKIVHTRETYDKVPDKTTNSTYPTMLFYDTTVTTGTLYVWPVPSASLTFYVNHREQLQFFDNLTEASVLPQGYQRAIEFNLAVELEAETGLPTPPNAVRLAGAAKRSIKKANHRPIYTHNEMYYLFGRPPRGNIETGE